MLTLNLLRNTRTSRDLKRPHLEAITGIDASRLRTLELRLAEPWFDEAVLLSYALGTHGIVPLLTSGSLTDCDLGEPTESDLPVWRSGARAPLSLACRMAVAFGLSDPRTLSVDPVARQVWEIVAANDRHPEHAGICPWCIADVAMGEEHLATCLPHNLYGPRDVAHEGAVLLPSRKHERTKGIPARGLKAQRLAHNMIQKEVAEVLDIHVNYYARLERADVPLTVEHADKLAAYYDVDRAVLYAPTEDA